MKFISVSQAAQKFGVTVRTIQKWASEGRINGAHKVGRSWLIPDNTIVSNEKADDSFTNTNIQNNEPCISMPLSLMCSSFKPGSVVAEIEQIEDIQARTIAMAEYHYLRAEPEDCVRMLEEFLGCPDENVSYSTGFLYLFANLSLNKSRIASITFNELKSYLQGIVTKNKPAKFNAPSIFVSSIVSVLLHSKNADLSKLKQIYQYLPEGARLFGAYVMAHDACIHNEYRRAQGIAETALAIASDVYPVAVIYLNLILSIALIHLKEIDNAKAAFNYAFTLALQDEFFEPIIEHQGLLMGLVEVCVREDYPKEYKFISEGVRKFIPGWCAVRNTAGERYITDKLSTIEFIVAMLFDRGWSMKEISAYMGISLRMVKYYIATVYDKLGIARREGLKQYMFE